MADTAIVNNQPLGSETPSTIDDYIRAMKLGIQERLNVDHYMPATGGAVVTSTTTWEIETNDAGKHRQVTFQAVLGAAPTADTGEGILYSFPDPDDAAVELWWEADGVTPRQLTKGGFLNLVEDDFATVIDADTILSFDAGGELTLVIDDDTIEYDAVNGLQIKVPAATSEGDASESGFVITGTYTGDGATGRTITIGTDVTVRHLVVKAHATVMAYEMIQHPGGTYRCWGQENSADVSAYLTPATNGFLVNNNAGVNTNLVSYTFFAHCVRT